MTIEQSQACVLSELLRGRERLLADDTNASKSIGSALESLVDFHNLHNQAGSQRDSTYYKFLDEVTAELAKMPRLVWLALFSFGLDIESAREEDSWWVCQRASAAQFLLEDHAAAISDAETEPYVREALGEIAEQTLAHIKLYGGIAEAEKRPVGFPPSHWWWTGNIAYVEPAWVPPPGWPPVRQWDAAEPATIVAPGLADINKNNVT